jgi:exopolysaccharide biosynthesis predicted pyruvyltransferase EpsI
MYSCTEIYGVGGGSAVIIVNTVLYWIPEDLETDSQHRQENFPWAKLQDKLWALTQSPTQWDTNEFHLVDPISYTPSLSMDWFWNMFKDVK